MATVSAYCTFAVVYINLARLSSTWWARLARISRSSLYRMLEDDWAQTQPEVEVKLVARLTGRRDLLVWNSQVADLYQVTVTERDDTLAWDGPQSRTARVGSVPGRTRQALEELFNSPARSP